MSCFKCIVYPREVNSSIWSHRVEQTLISNLLCEPTFQCDSPAAPLVQICCKSATSVLFLMTLTAIHSYCCVLHTSSVRTGESAETQQTQQA